MTEQHKAWYSEIRSIVSDRITNEEERMPSLTSMWRHWLRSCWVAKMWSNSIEEDPYQGLPPPEECGWCLDESGAYTYDWECPEVVSKVKDTINFLTKGCSCKKGCKTNQCGCRKKKNVCGPGCQCRGCTNVGAATETQPAETENATETESDSEESCNESLVSVETEIVTDFNDMTYSELI